MKTRYLLMFIALYSGLFGQVPRVVLNTIDFSRFPNIDFFVTFSAQDGTPFPLDSTYSSLIEITHNHITAPSVQIRSVFDLKEKSETELYISMVFDNSSSMEGRNKSLEAAAGQFIDGLQNGDYINIVDFGDEYKTISIPEWKEPLYGNQRIDFSNSKKLLKEKVITPNFTRKTYLYDALLIGLSKLNQTDVLGKKALIVFSDGADLGSKSTFKNVIDCADDYAIPIYAIDFNDASNNELKKLADLSGGVYYLINNMEDLAPLYKSILNTLKSQYRLTCRFPDKIINSSAYSVDLSIPKWDMHLSKEFQIDGEKVAYLNLNYLENIGQEDLQKYLDYITTYPYSRYRDYIELKIGNYWFQRGLYDKALAVYNRILRKGAGPVYEQAMYQKALVYERAKDYKKAKSILLDFLSKATATSLKPKSMIDLAQTYSAEGNYSAAIETYSNLVSQYSETEYAPEALLHSAKINLDMGQIDKADENLRQLLKQYPESKSVIFAKIELGNLENKKSNFPSAIDLFKGALNSTTDKELIEELKVKIGKSFQASGQLTEAANIFSDVMATTDNPELADSMHAALLFIKLRENQISDARRLFESFPELVQGQLLLSTPAIQAPASKPQSTLLVNGFSVGRLPSPNSQPIITIVENPAITQKYKVVGPIYKLAFENLPDSANPTVPVLFPVKRKWLETKRVIPGKSAIYCFANNHFSNVTSTYDSLTATYQINTSKSGLYLLFEEPLQTFTLYNIYFDVDKATIRKESEVNLFETIDRMKSYPDILLEIAGHTDSTGTDEHNVQLSLDRAESIKKFMVENGISPDRLKTRGYGSSLPVAPNTTEENLQKNRRTEFTILTELTALSTTDSVSTRKYIIYVNSFYNMKEAYDLRNFLKKRNYPATVMTNMQGVVTYYDIILGIFSTENEAESLLSQFSSEFKQFNPVIRTL